MIEHKMQLENFIFKLIPFVTDLIDSLFVKIRKANS